MSGRAPGEASGPWRELRARLDAAGFRPTKTLGQNFLLDPNLARAIVEDAGPTAGARVLEIGCGPGALTEPLAARGVELLAVEIDARLLAIARSRLERFPNVRFLEGDALAGKQRLSPGLLAELRDWQAWHVVANLPYSIAGPLLVLLSRLERPPLTLTVLVQDEVAERIVASPGGRVWGALSARLALVYGRRKGRAVGPQLFWPRPRVWSTVVRLELHPTRPPRSEVEAYDRLVHGLFQGRRKTLRNALTHAGWSRERVDAVLGGDVLARRRPEELEPAELLRLAETLGDPDPGIP